MEHRHKRADRKRTCSLDEPTAGDGSAVDTLSLPNIAELIDYGEITIGVVRPVGCVAVANDDDNCLAMPQLCAAFIYVQQIGGDACNGGSGSLLLSIISPHRPPAGWGDVAVSMGNWLRGSRAMPADRRPASNGVWASAATRHQPFRGPAVLSPGWLVRKGLSCPS